MVIPVIRPKKNRRAWFVLVSTVSVLIIAATILLSPVLLVTIEYSVLEASVITVLALHFLYALYHFLSKDYHVTGSLEINGDRMVISQGGTDVPVGPGNDTRIILLLHDSYPGASPLRAPGIPGGTRGSDYILIRHEKKLYVLELLFRQKHDAERLKQFLEGWRPGADIRVYENFDMEPSEQHRKA